MPASLRTNAPSKLIKTKDRAMKVAKGHITCSTGGAFVATSSMQRHQVALHTAYSVDVGKVRFAHA
jgi:hypothetical protein